MLFELFTSPCDDEDVAIFVFEGRGVLLVATANQNLAARGSAAECRPEQRTLSG